MAARLIFLLLALAGCSSAPQKSTGITEVDLVYEMSAADLTRYDFVDNFTSQRMLTESDCIQDLKNQAAGSGANLIRITSTEHDTCGPPPNEGAIERNCIRMRAAGYHRRHFDNN